MNVGLLANGSHNNSENTVQPSPQNYSLITFQGISKRLNSKAYITFVVPFISSL